MILSAQVYASWRAECCKADIEMETVNHKPHRNKLSPEEKKARRKAYAQRYKQEHPDIVNGYSRKSKAKKKAASGATNTRNGYPNLSPTV